MREAPLASAASRPHIQYDRPWAGPDHSLLPRVESIGRHAGHLDRYGAAVRRLAEKHRTLFVDSQAAFDEVLKTYYPASLNWDRVHPDHIGSMVLARAFVDAIGFDWTR